MRFIITSSGMHGSIDEGGVCVRRDASLAIRNQPSQWTTPVKGPFALLRNFLLLFRKHRFHAPHYFHFLHVQLIQEPLRPQVERTARQFVRLRALSAVVKAPTRGAALYCPA